MAGGILDLKHPMIPEAQQGRYSISAKTDRGEKLQQGFELREYGGLQSALRGGALDQRLASGGALNQLSLLQCCPSMR